MADLEDLSELGELVAGETPTYEEELSDIKELITDNTTETPFILDEQQTVEYSPAPGKARIYGTGEDPEWEQSLRESPLQLNADTGLYEVNSKLADDLNYKDVLPLLSLRADTQNKLEALKKEAYDAITNDPINADKYKEEYTAKATELLNQASLQGNELLRTTPSADTRSDSEKFGNAVTQGINHFLYNSAHQGEFANAFTSSMWEKTKDILPFVDPNINNISLPTLYQPTDINSDWESGVESISKSVSEIAATMLAAGGGAALGAGAGSVLPGLGTAVGASIGAGTGTVTGSAMTANAMYGESLVQNYQQYLADDMDETEAMMRAVTDATVEGGIEFGSGILGAGIAKLAKMGVPISKVVAAATKLAKSGGLRKAEAGYEVTKDAVKVLRKDIKSIAKSAGIVIGGGALGEATEEALQGAWGAGRHREEGQSWVQAITEHASEIAQQALWGAIGGAVGIGGARAVTKGVEFAGNKISTKLEEAARKKGEDVETINAAVEASVLENQEELAKFEEDKSSTSENTQAEQDTVQVGTVTPIGESYGTEVQGNQEVDAQGDTVLTDAPVVTPPINDEEAITSKLNSVIERLQSHTDNGELLYNEELSTLPTAYEFASEEPNRHTSVHTSDKIQHIVTPNKHFNSALISDMVEVIRAKYPELTAVLNEAFSDSGIKLYHAYDDNFTGSNNNYSTLIGNGTFFATAKMLTNNFGKNVVSVTVPSTDILSKSSIEKINKKLIQLHNNESNNDLRSVLAEFISGDIDENGNFTDNNINYDNLERGTTNKDTKYEVRTKILMLSRLSGKSVIAYKHTPKGETLEYVVYTKQANHPYVYSTSSVGNTQDTQTIESTPEEIGEQLKQLTTTRAEIAKANDIDNNEIENTIPGSVSDNGYYASDTAPIEGTGLAQKDEVPFTPETAKNTIEVHHNETVKAMDALGIKYADIKAPVEQQESETQQEPDTTKVSNEEVSSIHKYYGVKNFVESVGSAVTDKLGKAYKLVVKGELTEKEKIMQKLSPGIRGYVVPLVNNVIRISSSRDYFVILHETSHHMVAKLDLLGKALSDDHIKNLIKREHKRFTKDYPERALNEAAYRKKHQDITEEYFNNLLAAYGTDMFTPHQEVVDLINDALWNLSKVTGVDNTAQFELMRQQFVDYNLIRMREDGALTLANNNMSAVERLQKKQFDTKNLTNKQISRIERWLEKTKEFPSKVVTTLFNENYQLEKDAKRVGVFETLVKSQQALQTTNRIATAFTTGTGVYFNKGSLHKLKHLKNLTRIYLDTEALGDGYTNKLRSLLWAKQTIGESTGNQKKADKLLQLSKKLEYNNWLDARKDLKFLSIFCPTYLFQGVQITPEVITLAKRHQKSIAKKPVRDEESRVHSIKTDVASMDFNDEDLISRLNSMIQYIQNDADDHSTNKTTGKVDIDKKKEYIQENYILDKEGEVNTGLPLSDALEIYTTLQSDPKIAELESLENDVRNLFNALDTLMIQSSIAGGMRILQATRSVGAWYIPLLRFVDEGEELAVGVSSDGNTLKFRDGSTREVLDIFSSINHSINDVANRVTRDQAIEYILNLKDLPIFAQYMREIPADSAEVNASLMDIANKTIKSIDAKFTQATIRGEPLPAKREKAFTEWKNYFTKIKEDLSKGNVLKEDDRIQIFVDADPSKSNNNVIQRLEADGRVHYYLLHDNLYNFIYKQGKSLFNIASIDQYVKDNLAWVYKLNTFLNALQRASYTSLNAAFQVANAPRDTGDVAFKSSDKDTFVSGFTGFIFRYVNHLWGLSKLAGSLTTNYGREEFKMLTDLFGGAEQTQYKDGDYTASYLDYKYNKNGKIVRGGILGVLDEIATVAGMTDLGSRVVAIKRKLKQLGIDPYEIDATPDDYLSLELPKRLLKKYISDSDIESVFGKDKADVWKELSDNDFVPFVPEEFEKSHLEAVIHLDRLEKYIINNKVPPQLRTELQEIYDNCTIDFSKGTLTTRTLGKVFLFANARLQGGYQYFRYINNKKKAAAGAMSFLITAGIMAAVLGWEDDKPNYTESVLKGINIKPLNIKLPLQTFPMMFYRLGVHVGYELSSLFGKGSRYNTSFANEVASILWDNTAGAMEQPSGLYGVALTTPSFLLTGQNLSFSDTGKYHDFNYFIKQKAGANVDTLTKEMDTVLARSMSKWLVDNGVSYKYSTHEIDRYLRSIFGNSLHQMEGLLGIKTILDDKDNSIGWLDYANDQIKAFIESLAKPITITDIPHSEDSEYLKELEAQQMSLYDRFTGQIGAKKKDRVTPEMLPEEDRIKYQKHYDNAILSTRANALLQVIQRTAYRIDKDKVGGEKAFNEIAIMYKDLAYKFREIIDKHNGNLDDSVKLINSISKPSIQKSEELLKEYK